jgi:hypothetical protein
MNFAQSTADLKVEPAGHYTLRAEHWVSGYKERPMVAVKLGLRLLTENDFTYINALTKEAIDKVDGTDEQFKRRLVINAVAVSICDAEDASHCHDLFPCPDQQIPNALKPETITAMWDEIVRLTIATSPIYPEATDEDLVSLVMLLPDALDALEAVSEVRAAQARRLLRFVLDELTP